jgi:hypothetical protein
MYRFFLLDPIRFRKSIKVTIEHGHANDLANDYSSVAYWYQDEPHGPFPAMPLMKDRLPFETEEYLKALKMKEEMYKALWEPLTLERLSKEELNKILKLFRGVEEALNRERPFKAMENIETIMRIIKKQT